MSPFRILDVYFSKLYSFESIITSCELLDEVLKKMELDKDQIKFDRIDTLLKSLASKS